MRNYDENYLRDKLYRYMDTYGNSDYRTVAISQKLDILKNKQQKELNERYKSGCCS